MSYEKYVVIYPTVLYKEDLIELEHKLKELVHCNQGDFTISATVSQHDASANPLHSAEDLFKEGFPKVDQITFDAKEFGENKQLVKNIRLNIDKTNGDIRIYHANDRSWVNSVYTELNSLMTRKRAWYSSIKRALAPIFNVTMIGSFFMAFYITKTGDHAMLVLPLVLLLSAASALILSIKQIVFPYSRINLFSKSEDKRPNYEAKATLTGLSIIAVSVSSLFMMA